MKFRNFLLGLLLTTASATPPNLDTDTKIGMGLIESMAGLDSPTQFIASMRATFSTNNKTISFIRCPLPWADKAKELALYKAAVLASVAIIRSNDYTGPTSEWVWSVPGIAEYQAAFIREFNGDKNTATSAAIGYGKALKIPGVVDHLTQDAAADAVRFASLKSHIWLEHSDGPENNLFYVGGNTAWNGLWAAPQLMVNLGALNGAPGRGAIERAIGRPLPMDAVMVLNTKEVEDQINAKWGGHVIRNSYHVYWGWDEGLNIKVLGWVGFGSFRNILEYNVPWNQPERYPNPTQDFIDGANIMKAKGACLLCIWWMGKLNFTPPATEPDFNAMGYKPVRIAAVKAVLKTW